MSVFGVDYAWGRPGAAALKAAGARFVCRYLSHDTTGKNLTRAEADALSKAGLWLVVVWETTATRALAGRAAGVADARDAWSQARTCGMPDDRPIYFAVDWDATTAQQPHINEYLDGAASVLGRGRVGLYAGYGPIKRAFDAGKITYGWQTYAWSGGRWDTRAQLQQYSNDHRINNVGVDYDRAVAGDYGQWRVGVTGGDDMLTPEDLWEWDGIPAPPSSSTIKTNPTWKPSSHLTDINQRVRDLQRDVASLAAKVGVDVDEDAIAAGVLAGLTPERIAAAIPQDLAEQVVDALAARLAPGSE